MITYISSLHISVMAYKGRKNSDNSNEKQYPFLFVLFKLKRARFGIGCLIQIV